MFKWAHTWTCLTGSRLQTRTEGTKLLGRASQRAHRAFQWSIGPSRQPWAQFKFPPHRQHTTNPVSQLISDVDNWGSDLSFKEAKARVRRMRPSGMCDECFNIGKLESWLGHRYSFPSMNLVLEDDGSRRKMRQRPRKNKVGGDHQINSWAVNQSSHNLVLPQGRKVDQLQCREGRETWMGCPEELRSTGATPVADAHFTIEI